jgi:hypothetical protein
MQRCEITGRVHRTPRELADELARLDAAIKGVRAIEHQYEALFAAAAHRLPGAVGDAWNAAHDAMVALLREREEVRENPRPIPAREAGTWALVQQNID